MKKYDFEKKTVHIFVLFFGLKEKKKTKACSTGETSHKLAGTWLEKQSLGNVYQKVSCSNSFQNKTKTRLFSYFLQKMCGFQMSVVSRGHFVFSSKNVWFSDVRSVASDLIGFMMKSCGRISE